MTSSENIILHLEVEEEGIVASQFLAQASTLSRQRIKDAMAKGAVLLQPNKGKGKRLRRASVRLHRGDRVQLHYNAELLSLVPQAARLILDNGEYSLWDKPAGMMTQGNEFADHCSLLRVVECYFMPPRAVFPIHRLDREASGLVLLAHTPRSAAAMSRLFQAKQVYKRYRVAVLGNLGQSVNGEICSPLDGKHAITRYCCIEYHADEDISLLDVEIETGRTHQIRRHLASIGHPVMGDPRYGQNNKNRSGMKLRAVELRFQCPLQKRECSWKLD